MNSHQGPDGNFQRESQADFSPFLPPPLKGVGNGKNEAGNSHQQLATGMGKGEEMTEACESKMKPVNLADLASCSFSPYGEIAELLEAAARMLRRDPKGLAECIGWRLADAAGLFAQKAQRLEGVPGVHEFTGRGCAIYPPDIERRFQAVETGARQRTALYRHFDAKDRLLYVGISLSAVQRLAQHSQQAAWFDEITRVDVQWFGSRKEAIEAEIEAIRTERPLHNVIHNKGACPTCGVRPRTPMVQGAAC